MDNRRNGLAAYFLGWQCRLRQHAVRKESGRPGQGMQADLFVKVSDRNLGPLNTLIIYSDPEELTSEFRHIVRKTQDPRLRREGALKLLSSAYYQYPQKFDDRLFATFSVDSELAALLTEQGECRLELSQYQQTFSLHCAVSEIPADDPAYQAVYWHNHMFNATLPATITVLAFAADWLQSLAEPGPQTN